MRFSTRRLFSSRESLESFANADLKIAENAKTSRRGRPRKTVEEKRRRKTETQRYRREGRRMEREQALEQADAI
jgi:hypothetical protein